MMVRIGEKHAEAIRRHVERALGIDFADGNEVELYLDRLLEFALEGDLPLEVDEWLTDYVEGGQP